MATPLELIQQYGDLLERAMFAAEKFAEAFDLYPTFWAICVRDNRKPGCMTLANADWIRFAERHYSCIGNRSQLQIGL
jgi:hypothetical protein